MEVFKSLDVARGKFSRPVVTMGNFDGVHKGHQVILAQVRSDADRLGVAAVALTFDPHPVAVLRPEAAPRLLMSLKDRLDGLASCGLDATVVQTFTDEFAATDADVFVSRFLVGVLDTQKMVVGHDVNFGHDRSGSIETLVGAGALHGFDVDVVSPVLVGGTVVHSNVVRDKVARGEVVEAAALLGRPHVVRGHVVRGAGRGTGLGFATANLKADTEAVPADGVYVTRAVVGGKHIDGVTSIGHTPTFGGDETAIEVHLFSDCGDLYGQEIAVEFFERVRDQQKFADADALVAQIKLDVETARKVLGRRP
jgi:riboflavin kinase/FMN adenylyltransferase